ncbi:hypothetical protein QBC47DRAFT_363207 [Echria macrotheca]|uniref:PAR32 protein n=1 Tax=Echria macrotheca TaxID=438768 RepID=A0AAJ0B6H4_9PEZI|nr:hypothetical protein QBC47DRAFT_363207 [Echria macrotheca]
MSNLQSSGRGGAGNIRESSKSTPVNPVDLQTPTLKTAVVTTGRGGSGNMAKNTDPVETRLRQDVEPVIRRDSQGATHIGRGGSGNVFNAGSDEAEAAKRELEKAASAVVGGDKEDGKKGGEQQEKEAAGWAEKGKNLLFGKK